MRKLYFRKWLVALTLLLAAVCTNGQTVEIDGIAYVLYSETAAVTAKADDTKYSGAIVIPSVITYDGNTYSITGIAANAFDSCSSLTSIIIPDGVTWIDEHAFRGCSSLTSINIPDGVTSIGPYAFATCSNLTSVVSKIEVPFEFGRNAFAHISDNCVLTVPRGTREAYLAAGWTESIFKGGVVEDTSIELSENDAAYSGSASETYSAVTVTRSIKAGRWSTLCLPYALNEIPAGWGVWKLTNGNIDEEAKKIKLTFTEVGSIEAGVPVMVKTTMDVTTLEAVVPTLADAPTGVEIAGVITMKGVFVTSQVPVGDYFVYGNKFYYVDKSPVDIKGFRAYFEPASGTGAKAVTMNLGDDMLTLVDGVITEENIEGVTYTLSGQRTARTAKPGIYIRDGKKIVIK